MNRIVLAYAPENADLASSVDKALSSIGIPFEHVSKAVAAGIREANEPVLLLLTDNFLKNRDCVEGLLPVLQQLSAEDKLTVVLAGNAEHPEPVEIDRMANLLHYLSYWQNVWLKESDAHQQISDAEKVRHEAQIDALRKLANEIGDIVSLFRTSRRLSWEQLLANDFEQFFRIFHLEDWHGQYKKMVSGQPDDQPTAQEPPHLPPTPLQDGILHLEPVPIPDVPTAEIPEVIETPVPENEPEKVEQAIKDAWFWLEKGHLERGLELFQLALEQFPENAALRAAYDNALAKYAPQDAKPPEPTAETVANTDAASGNIAKEAESYDLMGDMALERGDYLFAKYCWDRVVELEPNFPSIYKKLGLLTTEHLSDYQETARIYLHKALEQQPDDEAVLNALKSHETPPRHTPAEPEPAISKPEPTKAGMPLVLITGATSGIGRATAEIFAKNGYRLILTGRRVDRLVALKDRFEQEYASDILLLPFDVRDAGAVEAALSNLPESFSEVNILINNAGLAKGLSPIHEGNLEHWETMIDTNIKGLLYVSRIISRQMVQRKKGLIINVGSSAGKEAYPNGNVYCATKFAVDALTKSMRFDLHAHGIKVGQVSPGHVEETEFALNRFDGDAERARIYNDFQPLKSSDVAEAIYFMATRPPHVNIQDLHLFATQQASSMVIDRSGR